MYDNLNIKCLFIVANQCQSFDDKDHYYSTLLTTYHNKNCLRVFIIVNCKCFLVENFQQLEYIS